VLDFFMQDRKILPNRQRIFPSAVHLFKKFLVEK